MLKQLTRRRVGTILTLLGVATSMFLFSAVQAMQSGVREATTATSKETTLVVYRQNRYCPFTSRLPQHYERRIAAVPGVTGVVPIQIVVSNCRASLDDGFVVRLEEDGAYDTTFSGGDGKDFIADAFNAQVFDLALQPDGKVVVSGYRYLEAGLWRYNADGSLDASFGSSGFKAVSINVAQTNQWTGVAYRNNKLYAGGTTGPAWTDWDIAVGRFNAGVELDQVVFFQQDANFNVTSITDANGNVLERYRLTAYGERTVLNVNFTVKGDGTVSDYGNQYGHQGGRQDLHTGLYLYNIGGLGREYHVSLGRWGQRDRAGYVNGQNIVEYITSNPTNYFDPTGLAKGDKSAGEYDEHLRKYREAEQRAKELENNLRDEKGKKAQEAIRGELDALRKSIKGHAKEIGQKWPTGRPNNLNCGNARASLAAIAWEIGWQIGTMLTDLTSIDEALGDFIYDAAYNPNPPEPSNHLPPDEGFMGHPSGPPMGVFR